MFPDPSRSKKGYRLDVIVAVDKVDVRPIVPKAVTFTGTVVGAGPGMVAVNVKNPPKDAKNPMSFQIVGTKVVGTKGGPAMMNLGDDVTIHATSRLDVIVSVEKIDVRAKKKGGK